MSKGNGEVEGCLVFHYKPIIKISRSFFDKMFCINNVGLKVKMMLSIDNSPAHLWIILTNYCFRWFPTT